MIPKFVSHISAAKNEPSGPRLGRATMRNVSATASTQSTDGSRAVHSFRAPKSWNEPATSQLISGGFRR